MFRARGFLPKNKEALKSRNLNLQSFPMATAGATSGSGQGSSNSSKRKRSNAAPATTGLFSGVVNSAENKDIDLLCPICMDIFNECYISKCGHSFCYECICRCLEQSPRCPKCNFHLDGKNDVFPNFALNELVAKHKNVEEQRRKHNNAVASVLSQPEAAVLKDMLFDSAPKLGLIDIECIMNVLAERLFSTKTISPLFWFSKID